MVNWSRKNYNEKDEKIKICIQAFDLLFLNGQSLLEQNFESRRGLLRNEFDPIIGKFMLAKSTDSSNLEDLECFLY